MEDKFKLDLEEKYQIARVEGFIPDDWELEDYLIAEVKKSEGFRDKVLAAWDEMPRNSRSLTYLLNDEGYLKHYTLEDYRKGLHPYSLGLYELHEEWKEKAQQYLGEEEE